MGYQLMRSVRCELLEEVLFRLPYDGKSANDRLEVNVKEESLQLYISHQYEDYHYTKVTRLEMQSGGRRRSMGISFIWKRVGVLSWESVGYAPLDHAKILAKVNELITQGG